MNFGAVPGFNFVIVIVEFIILFLFEMCNLYDSEEPLMSPVAFRFHLERTPLKKELVQYRLMRTILFKTAKF